MEATIIIDPNVRVEGGLTFAGFEDLMDGMVPDVGASVRVCEPESGLVGAAEVARVDSERGLIYLHVDWVTLRPVEVVPVEVATSNFVTATHCGVWASYSARPLTLPGLWSQDVRAVNHLVRACESVQTPRADADRRVITNCSA